MQWLLRARVDRVRELLEATDLGIDQIATRSGLGSATNLRQHFRHAIGTTPTQYRRSFAANETTSETQGSDLKISSNTGYIAFKTPFGRET